MNFELFLFNFAFKFCLVHFINHHFTLFVRLLGALVVFFPLTSPKS